MHMLQVVFASAERRLADRNHRPAGSLVYANEQSKGINQPPAPKESRAVSLWTRVLPVEPAGLNHLQDLWCARSGDLFLQASQWSDQCCKTIKCLSGPEGSFQRTIAPGLDPEKPNRNDRPQHG